jgi:tape measure domain-containing protein
MAGEIMTAWIAISPSMRGFGKEAARQIGPQARAVGAKAGTQAGSAFVESASKESAGWFAQTAKGAIKNVALYGSMYLAISKVQQGISAMFDSMVGFNAEIEQATVGFETLLGSSAAAKDEMAWIQQFAKETPFNYKDLVGYSQQLLALGFNAEQSKDVLQATGDAAAALGRGSESIARINLALGQMWTKGKVQSQEMLQLTEAGIGAWQILADAYGTTVENVQEAVTKGQIKASEAVPALIAGMNSQFGGLMAKQSQTFAGVVSNIQDTMQQELANAGEPLFEELKTQAQGFLDALNDPQVLDMMHDLGQMLADAVKVLGEAARLAWQFRDALIAVGIAVAASKLLTRIPAGSMLSADMWFSATRAQEAYAAGLKRTTALQAGLTERGAGALRGAGQIAGLVGLVDGYRRVSEAAHEGEVSAAGFAESIGLGAVAGATFGSVIPGVGTAVGAAAGAVVGLTTSLWSYSQASQAANKDTSAIQQSLQQLGLDAGLAQVALDGVTNSQLEAAGGAGRFIEALKSGTLKDYTEQLKDQADKLREQASAAAEASDELLSGDASKLNHLTAAQQAQIENNDALMAQSKDLDALVKNLTDNSSGLAYAQAQVTASQYQAAYAADMQTGALGAMTEAAWNAVVAQGGLSNEALIASVRMEGLAGVAGYATQMLTGIPTNTAINFSTNASDIIQQIVNLIAAAQAATDPMNPNLLAAIGQKQQQLGAQLGKMLTTPKVTLDLPKVPKTKTGGGSKVGKSVSDKAKEAARQLEQDRSAQRAFGKAFGSLMDAALEGDFEEYQDRLADTIQSLIDQGYKKAADKLKAQSKALTQAAKDYAALTAKLNTAQDAYDDLTQAMQDQYDTSRDLILGLGKVTDAQSFDQLAYLLGETTSAALQYQDVLAQLKAEGLSDDLWNQLAQAGPESMGLAQSILAQGQDGIDQLNALSEGLVGAAESMGTLVANSMYGEGAKAMDAYIKGLQSGEAALSAQMETIANNVLTKTATAITPGNAGYSKIDTGPQQVINNLGNITIDVSKLKDLEDVQAFINMLKQAPTTVLVNAAGTVVS